MKRLKNKYSIENESEIKWNMFKNKQLKVQIDLTQLMITYVMRFLRSYLKPTFGMYTRWPKKNGTAYFR